MDLAKFLAARLDEDDAEALKLHDRLDGNVPLQHAFAARVLREVEAKRRILAEHRPYPIRGIESDGCRMCRLPWPCLTVRAFAEVWSDHPDFDSSWIAHTAPERMN